MVHAPDRGPAMDAKPWRTPARHAGLAILAAAVLHTHSSAPLKLSAQGGGPPALPPPTIVVDTAAPTGGGCTLGAAIIAANTDTAFGGCPAGQGRDIVFVPAGIYEMTGPGYTDPNGWGDSALPGITTSAGNQLEIRGAGSDQTLLVRPADKPAMRFFLVFGDLTLRSLNVEGGQTAGDGGVALLFPGPSSFGLLRTISSRFAHNSARSGGVVAGSANYDRSRFEAIDSVFTANHAIAQDGIFDGYGGVYHGDCNGSAVVTTSRFDGNDARIGGAIYSHGCSGRTTSIAVSGSTFVDNVASVRGGAIAVEGDYAVKETRFLGNRTDGAGGAIDGAQGSIVASTFTDNEAGTNGGAINSGSGGLTVGGSTFARNEAGRSGGALMLNDVSATVTNTTFSANAAIDNAGAIFIGSSHPIRFNNLTVTGTRSSSAIFNGGGAVAAVEVANSIVAGNMGDDWYHSLGTVTSLGHNLFGNEDGSTVAWDSTDRKGTSASPLDAKLGPLAPNGGLTETHMPLADSPALDKGDPSAPGSDFPGCEAVDQRGAARPGAGTLSCDIGAVEREMAAGPRLSIGKTAMTPVAYVGQPLTYRISVFNTGGGVATGVVVTDQPVQMTPAGATSSQGFCTIEGGTVRCDLGVIDADSQATVDVVVTPTVAGVLSNVATLTADGGIVPPRGIEASGDVVAREPIQVDTTRQSPDVAGDCTLGEAIQAANTDRAVDGCVAGHHDDLILLPAGRYEMTGPGYTDPNGWGEAALPGITTSAGNQLEIRGAGSGQTLLVRPADKPAMRFFLVFGDLTLRSLSAEGGQTTGDGGVALLLPGPSSFGLLRTISSRFALNAAANGGVAAGSGNYDRSRFETIDSTFTDNHAVGTSLFPGVGGVYSGACNGSAVATRSRFDGNDARVGGAIYSKDCNHLTPSIAVADSTFVDNTAGLGHADGSGGAITFLGDYTIMRTRFLHNRAGGSGGAIDGARGTFTDSTFTDNEAGANGGAISSGSGSLTVSGSTFARNTAGHSGGALMLNDVSAAVTNGTFSANAATDNAGAIFIGSGRPIRFNNLTVTGTRSPSAIFQGWGATATVEVANSIVAGNMGDGWYHSHGTVTSLGHNLIGNGDGGNVAWNPGEAGTTAAPIDPRLGPLQDNGGPTETHALLDGSPALNGGDPGAPGSGGSTCEATDQRGVVRPGSGTTICDIGASESEVDLPPEIVDRGNQTSDEGTTIDLPMVAIDPEGQLPTYSVDPLRPLPPGLHIDALTGHITGFLGYQSAGTYQVAVEANDGLYTSSLEFWWTVRNVPCHPIAQNDAATTSANTEVEILALANDVSPVACGPIGASVSTFSLPEHGALTYDSEIRTFYYVPAVDFVGVDGFTYTIVNSDGGSSTATVTITVTPVGPIHVNTQTQEPAAADDCTLSQAIEAANSHLAVGGCVAGGSPAVIRVPPGTYTLAAINNTTAGRANGLPVVTTDLTIQSDGGDATNTVIERSMESPAFGIFHIASSHKFALAGITVRGGQAATGGGILNDGGTVALVETRFTGNRVVGDGGGYADVNGGALTVNRSAFVGNGAERGGAIGGSTVNATASTFSGNTAVEGGALAITKGGSLVNVTVSGNAASEVGGGVWFAGSGVLELLNVTVTANRVLNEPAGGLVATQGLVYLANSIVAGNMDINGHADLSNSTGRFESRGFNLIGNGTDAALTYMPNDRAGTSASPIDPRLEPLANNGGPTDTHLPLPGSPALDAGNPAVPGSETGACPSTDQRGIARPADGNGDGARLCDIGAVELLPIGVPVPLVIEVEEHISVSEPLTLRPSAWIKVDEAVAVTDAPVPLPSTWIKVDEAVTVTEAPVPLPSTWIKVDEAVAVTEAPVPLSSMWIKVDEAVAVAEAPVPLPSTWIKVDEAVAVAEASVPLPSTWIKVDEAVGVRDDPDVGNTTVGNDVAVMPIDPTTGDSPVTVTFSTVTHRGVTSVTTSSSGPMSPVGFEPGQPPLYFDITTTAGFSGPITACFNYGAIEFRSTTRLRLFHFEGGRWVDQTSRLDRTTTTACAVVNSLSPFAVFEPSNLAPVADAGANQTIEVTSPGGAMVTLNGSASSDPDGDALIFVWDGPFGSRSGATVSVTLARGTHAITLTVDDGIGGTATDVVIIDVRDTVAPSVTIASPANISYTLNAVVVGSYACADGGSGIASCLGPSSSGSAIDTATEGNHTFGVTGTDAAGNVTTKTVTYIVTGLEGRMNGEGDIDAGGRQHHFTFRIAERSIGRERGDLRYSVRTQQAGTREERINRFESTSIGPIAFWNNPAFKPGTRPKPKVDSAVFSGTGAWNGVTGHTFEARAVDAGEPGRGRDTFELTIRDAHGSVVTRISGTLTGGNIQSHRLAEQESITGIPPGREEMRP